MRNVAKKPPRKAVRNRSTMNLSHSLLEHHISQYFLRIFSLRVEFLQCTPRFQYGTRIKKASSSESHQNWQNHAAQNKKNNSKLHANDQKLSHEEKSILLRSGRWFGGTSSRARCFSTTRWRRTSSGSCIRTTSGLLTAKRKRVWC